MTIPDGIYIGLSNEAYQDDKALGSGDLKGCLSNCVQWHGRKRNPAIRELLGLEESEDNPAADKTKDAGKRFGQALHTILLEGEEAFEARYCEEPENPGWPATIDQIRDGLAGMGRALPKSASKREALAEARLARLPTADDWAAQREAILDGREALSMPWQRALRLTRAVFDRHPTAKRYLEKGLSEVSVFWTDATGLRLKCRFDYLRVRPVVDLKTYRCVEGREPIDTFVSAIESLGYDFQAAHYMDCRINVLPGLVERELVYDARRYEEGLPFAAASAADGEFLARVAADPSPQWVWLAVMTLGVPEVDVVRMEDGLSVFASAQVQVEEAKANYRRFREVFGDSDDEIWVSSRGLVKLVDQSFHGQRAISRGAVTWEQDE